MDARPAQVPWGNLSAGPADGEVDVAVARLPIPRGAGLSWRVVTTGERWVAVPPGPDAIVPVSRRVMTA
ncbi:hypothetical protein P3L51_09200 [Streptomyces sp. PSRA5]|uniref:hypothetical protein n=1 Tax=Streptomyces panacea TaxID=3035064 RepID=UPI00339C5B24